MLGIFWKRANKWGAVLDMAAGLGITFYYNSDDMTLAAQRPSAPARSPTTSTGDPADRPAHVRRALGFVVIIVVSLLTPAPKPSAGAR
ncbi:MAG: hypothetical protein U1F25_15585 [Rubrivivax sp.]